VESAAVYGSRNNRLMYLQTFNTAPNPDVLLATTWYTYNAVGNVERVVTKFESTPLQYSAVRFVYAKNGTAVTFVVGEAWTWDGVSGCPDNYAVSFAREFRYDSGRARYLNRQLDADDLMLTPPVYTALSETWTDYDGDEAYRDFSFSGGQPVNGAAYMPGAWRSVSGIAAYLHNDLLGTLRQTTSATGVPGSSRVFTAFGERRAGPIDRFGYVGAWGYQRHTEFPFLHVGARYYDPASGRFLQRDPAGLFGARNVYSYVANRPTALVDPDGLQSSLQTPEGIIAVIEADIASSGSSLLTYEGTTYTITSTLYNTTAAGRTTLGLYSHGREIVTLTWEAGKTVVQNELVRTSCGLVIVQKTSSCGATGLEAIPFALLAVWLTRRRHHRAVRSAEI